MNRTSTLLSGEILLRILLIIFLAFESSGERAKHFRIQVKITLLSGASPRRLLVSRGGGAVQWWSCPGGPRAPGEA